MREHLFDHVDIPTSAIHIPDGLLPRENVAEACARYEELIREAGGIDLQLLGIGRTGHVGFNEPGSATESRTRLITPATAVSGHRAQGAAQPRARMSSHRPAEERSERRRCGAKEPLRAQATSSFSSRGEASAARHSANNAPDASANTTLAPW
jgi:hypothetical protein